MDIFSFSNFLLINGFFVPHSIPVADHIICKATENFLDVQKGILKLLVPLFFNDYHDKIDTTINRILSNYLDALSGRYFMANEDYNDVINILATAVVYPIFLLIY